MVPVPNKIPTCFATSQLGGSLINGIPQTTTNAGYASWQAGFTSANDTPIASGGIPPRIQDFNGILYDLSNWIMWLSAGAPISYDSAYQTLIGGYPLGATLQTSTENQYYQSTVANNTNNPTTGGAGWQTVKMIPVVFPVAPQLAYQNVDLRSGGGTSQTFSFTLVFTAPCAGFAQAISAMSFAELPASGANMTSGVTLSGSGVSNSNNGGASGGAGLPGNPYPLTSFAVCQCNSGAAVTATFQVSTTSVAPLCQWQQTGTLIFIPTY